MILRLNEVNKENNKIYQRWVAVCKYHTSSPRAWLQWEHYREFSDHTVQNIGNSQLYRCPRQRQPRQEIQNFGLSPHVLPRRPKTIRGQRNVKGWCRSVSNLFSPFPVEAAYHASPNSLHHNPSGPRHPGGSADRVGYFHLKGKGSLLENVTSSTTTKIHTVFSYVRTFPERMGSWAKADELSPTVKF